jgi:hypothetical protein
VLLKKGGVNSIFDYSESEMVSFLKEDEGYLIARKEMVVYDGEVMAEQSINSLSILDLQDLFKGCRSMAIVGSSSSVLEWENGEYIDSYDIVVRFNRSTVDGKEKSVGSRTDIIVANDANSLEKAPPPEETSQPKCVVTYANTKAIGNRTEKSRNRFFQWVKNTPLFLTGGPEILVCDIPKRKRGFTMGTYAMASLPYYLRVERLFVTGFTMFGEVNGGTGHYSKKSDRANSTWHDANLEGRVIGALLGNLECDVTVTSEVARLIENQGYSAKILSEDGSKTALTKPKKKKEKWYWYLVGRVAKLCLMAGYSLRSAAERKMYK